MADRVKGIPDNSSLVMPKLFCRDVAAEIDFCKNTFDAVELGRRPGPDGTVVHGLMTIGSEMIMIETECPTSAWPAPPAWCSGVSSPTSSNSGSQVHAINPPHAEMDGYSELSFQLPSLLGPHPISIQSSNLFLFLPLIFLGTASG